MAKFTGAPLAPTTAPQGYSQPGYSSVNYAPPSMPQAKALPPALQQKLGRKMVSQSEPDLPDFPMEASVPPPGPSGSIPEAPFGEGEGVGIPQPQETAGEAPIEGTMDDQTMVAPKPYQGPTEDSEQYGSEDDYNERYKWEAERQKANTRYQNIDYSSLERLQKAFPEGKTSDISTVQSRAKSLGESLIMTNIDRSKVYGEMAVKLPEGDTGMDVMQTMTGAKSPIEAAGYMTTTLGVLSQQFGGKADPNLISDLIGQSEDAADFEGWFDLDESTGDSMATAEPGEPQAYKQKDGGVPMEHFIATAGKVMNKVATKAEFDPNTGAFMQMKKPQDFNHDMAGALALKSAQDAGLVVVQDRPTGAKNADGTPEMKKVVYLTPKNGVDFKNATAAMASDYNTANRSKSQIVPVDDKGDYVGAQKGERRKFKATPDQGIPSEVQQSTAQLGRVPLSLVPEADFYRRYAMSQVIANSVVKSEDGTRVIDYKPDDQSGFGDWFALDSVDYDEAGENPMVERAHKVRQKVDGLVRRNDDYNGVVLEGVPRYAKHWTDATVNRVYNDSVDANLQANKDARAIYGPPPVALQVTGTKVDQKISEDEANSFWDSLRDTNRSFSPRDNELSFLMAAAHALAPLTRKGADDLIGPWLLTEVATPNNIKMWAELGRALNQGVNAAIGPKGDPDRRSKLAALDINQPIDLAPEAQKALEDIRSMMTNNKAKLGDDNWGFILRGLMDVANYMDAKTNGSNTPTFTPRMTTAIDQNSAGRTFAALDIGDTETLERTGVLWDTLDQLMGVDEIKSTQPRGTPRTYFMEKAIDEGLQKAIGMAGGANDPFLKATQDVFKEFSNDVQSGPGFVKKFGKTPLMTSDYGKPTKFHHDSARAIMKKKNSAGVPFGDAIKKVLMDAGKPNDPKDIENFLAKVYHTTLNTILDKNAAEAPKLVVRLGNMLGRIVNIDGYYGEAVSLGGWSSQSVQDFDMGLGIPISIREYKADITKAAKAKKIDDKLFTPRAGSFQINGFGPWLGQYRESILTGGLVNTLNPNMVAPSQMQWIQTVHDNAIMDSRSFARGLYAANNIIAPKAMEWSPSKAILKGTGEIMNDLRAKINHMKPGEQVDIGVAGTLPLFLVELDYDYENLLKLKDASKTMPKLQEEYLKFLDNPKNGFVKAHDRESNHQFVTKEQFKGLMEMFLKSNQVKEKIADWAILGEQNKQKQMGKLRRTAGKGRIAFFN